MAKLTVNEEHNENTDDGFMELTFSCWGEKATSAQAVEEVNRQSEAFLTELKNLGFDISRVSLPETRIRDFSYKNTPQFCAWQKMRFCTNFDMEFLDKLSDVIQDDRYNAELEIDFL